ncbi:MAG: DUF349 domain-containing protein [Chitinophagales bacterium]
MKDAVIAKLEALLQGDNVAKIRGDVRDVRNEFNALRKKQRDEAFEKHKAERLEAKKAKEEKEAKEAKEGKKDKETEEVYVKFEMPEDPLDAQFEALYTTFKERLTKHNEEQAAILAEKLKQKKVVLEEIKGFVANIGDNIGKAFEQFNTIQDKWKAISISKRDEDKNKDTAMEYSHQCDLFFHNVNMMKEMRDVDLQRNLVAKTAIIEKMKALIPLENIRTMDSGLKRLQKEFNEIGQVPFDVKDKIYQEFREHGDAVFAKVQAFYDERRGEQRENLKLKIALCEEVHQIAQETANLTKAFEWQEITKKVLELQKNWKTIGYSEENEKVWDIFRNACDAFFSRKKEFFGNLDKGREENKVKKLALIEKADAEKHSTDWRTSTDFFIKLQKEWKAVGSAPRSEENKLWEKFRAACDVFFDAKKAHYATAEEQEVVNLGLKKALIERIAAYELDTNIEKNFEVLKAFSKEFSEIGYVPIKQKDTIYGEYKAALDAKYGELKLDRSQKNKLRLEGEMEALMGAHDADHKIDSERRKIRNRLDQLREEIAQYENNLGFFKAAKSNKKNPLLKQVEDKIKTLRGEMSEQKTRLRMLPKPGSQKAEKVENAESTEKIESPEKVENAE